jgi:hypothetical protein
MDLDAVFQEVTERLERTGGSITAGYTSQSTSGGGRWQVIITWGNPQGRDTLTAVGVGQDFITALEKAITGFREG